MQEINKGPVYRISRGFGVIYRIYINIESYYTTGAALHVDTQPVHFA